MTTPRKDKIRLGPALPSGHRVSYRRRAETPDETEVGVFVEAKDGDPIPEGAEVISVSATHNGEDCDGWHDSETIYRNGPAQVATPAYRDGYDRIFGRKQKVGEA